MDILHEVRSNLHEGEATLQQGQKDLAAQMGAKRTLEAGGAVENLSLENCLTNIADLRAAITNKVKMEQAASATKIPGMQVKSSDLYTKGQVRAVLSRLGSQADVPARGQQTIISNPDQTAWVITCNSRKSASTRESLYKVEYLVKDLP